MCVSRDKTHQVTRPTNRLAIDASSNAAALPWRSGTTMKVAMALS